MPEAAPGDAPRAEVSRIRSADSSKVACRNVPISLAGTASRASEIAAGPSRRARCTASRMTLAIDVPLDVLTFRVPPV